MSYDVVDRATKENLNLLINHGNDRTLMALYNVSVAISNLAEAVSADFSQIEGQLAQLRQAVERLERGR